MVLVVDDEPQLGELLHIGLSHRGIESLVAVSPAEALDLASRYPIALLVTDLQMPGMTGIELAARLRRLQARVPVILVSATPDAGSLVIEPPSAFLAKPFSLRDLAATATSLMVQQATAG
jgi:DNA-binding response OmpR family regulator